MIKNYASSEIQQRPMCVPLTLVQITIVFFVPHSFLYIVQCDTRTFNAIFDATIIFFSFHFFHF